MQTTPTNSLWPPLPALSGSSPGGVTPSAYLLAGASLPEPPFSVWLVHRDFPWPHGSVGEGTFEREGGREEGKGGRVGRDREGGEREGGDHLVSLYSRFECLLFLEFGALKVSLGLYTRAHIAVKISNTTGKTSITCFSSCILLVSSSSTDLSKYAVTQSPSCASHTFSWRGRRVAGGGEWHARGTLIPQGENHTYLPRTSQHGMLL